MSLSRWCAAPLALAALCALASGPVRERIVRAWPQGAALFAQAGLPVNLDGLAIGPVQATLRTEDGRAVLVVESEIANLRDASTKVPVLRVSVRDGAGLPLYTWTTQPTAKTLASRGKLPFRTRLTAPPAGADVLVEFVQGV